MSSPKTSAIKHRNGLSKVFVTFPKSNETKYQFTDKFKDEFRVSEFITAEEKHQDGTPHLHSVIVFEQKYTKAQILNYFKEKYPNDYKRIDIQAVKSYKDAIKYVKKEDNNPYQQLLKKKQRCLLKTFQKYLKKDEYDPDDAKQECTCQTCVEDVQHDDDLYWYKYYYQKWDKGDFNDDDINRMSKVGARLSDEEKSQIRNFIISKNQINNQHLYNLTFIQQDNFEK